ncbi:helix-turn-helix transcriptional regulator [Streptococcus suis]|uniref:helix-turn-helix domain-containing protein n=1 Tax=Streptococcus suis TaxID=1307 RepID=UPI0005BDF6D5|nr:helix-turn-helix transcriptional regulator [Streptococcus suis]NQN00561.1 helix-turn-helix transcriptional regulator [Streptococcus suis]CYX48889.1 prophage LambdaSa2%2C repressor protein [Streptococcus suis]CYY54819.1 prophage LambdaSa2%2C repressor protein [Streptococcus suis]CZA37527.1 prophage LambdaSa2%2C repressor protein [Streptococcus suis]
MMSLLDRIKLLASTHQLSLAELERKLDFSNGSLRKWASSTPSGDKIEKVADYFNVSTDYLFGRTDNQRIANDETAVIDGQVVDLREAAAHTMLFDGRPLDENDIDFITAVLTAHFKNKQKD